MKIPDISGLFPGREDARKRVEEFGAPAPAIGDNGIRRMADLNEIEKLFSTLSRGEKRARSLRQKRATHSVGLARDHSEKRARGAAGNSPTVLPVFQGALAQTKEMGKFALRKSDLLPDRLHVDLVRHVDFTAIVLASGECLGLSGTLDHSLARGWLLLFHGLPFLPR